MDLLKAKCCVENSWSLKPVLFVAILFHCLDKRKHSVFALANCDAHGGIGDEDE